MTCQRDPHTVGIGFPETCAALDVGEQECFLFVCDAGHGREFTETGGRSSPAELLGQESPARALTDFRLAGPFKLVQAKCRSGPFFNRLDKLRCNVV